MTGANVALTSVNSRAHRLMVGSVWLPRYILAGVILPSTNALYQFVAMPGTFVPGLTAKKVGQKGVCAPFLFPRGRYYARIDKKGILLR